MRVGAVSDQRQSLPERAAKSALFTAVGHGAATLSLAAIVWLGSTVTSVDKQLTQLRAEVTSGLLPRIEANERDIEAIRQDLANRTRDRLTAVDAAAMEARMMREITLLQAQMEKASRSSSRP